MTHDTTQSIREQHSSLAAVLRSLTMMIAHGPADEPDRFFDVMRAMLFYIDEFPERLHHPRESNVLFPRVLKVAPQLMNVIEALEHDHLAGEQRVRDLQHLLLAWELLGESRRQAFEQAAAQYVRFYLDHMRVEETEVLPLAKQLLSPEDWAQLNAAFDADPDPLTTVNRQPIYDRLFSRIVLAAPSPVGVGPAFGRA
ncbi:hemerythrin domain-containing protein [Caenimonas koreensis DSM 17982]|uniref:Hemerythrin domain-containing protein n=1 Tax=Caenimonas koreensis DSM 17982 TaxID=1121255 RepID=A0A844B8K6_9BURK|nr:hemerythrin domain-containing protein [Caenimonas koreensis]MRD47939.1 hemerythrin domain-containing protein [Caenimonas koreensis DSM 17982]